MKRNKIILALVMSALMTFALATAPAQAASGKVQPPPKDAIAGSYIVVLKDSISAQSVKSTVKSLAKGNKVLVTYTSALKGFALKASAKEASQLAADSRVDSVYPDGKVQASATQVIPGPPNTAWGLNRIDQRIIPPNAVGTYRFTRTGTGVRAYVIDTGIQTSHVQFGGRALFSFTAPGLPLPGVDCHGHGTHVAGTIGSASYGVAKNVLLRGVKVLDCNGSGSFSGVIAGVDFVTRNSIKPAIANMSLGGGAFPPLDTAVNNSIRSGVQYALAAGNSSANACLGSPGRTTAAITVGATGNFLSPNFPISDARPSFSNFGPCLDIFAPGSLIKSTCSNISNAGMGCTGPLNNRVTTISGTSMATPHVAGVAALVLQTSPRVSPLNLRNFLVDTLATRNIVTNPGLGSPNRLLFTNQ
jgi:subtilisin family serine protease